MKKLIAVILIAATLIFGSTSANLLASDNDELDDIPDVYFIK